jgi:hypothetical protein
LLERGPIAVFERGSFLGQGMLEPLPVKATATVPFALERSVGVQRKVDSDVRSSRLRRIEASMLFLERDSVMRTVYTLKSGADRQLEALVRHPRQPDWRLHDPPTGTEDNVGSSSALVPLTIRAHGTSELTVDERRAFEQQEDWLSELADVAVKAYLADARSDPKVVSQLSAAWQTRSVLKKHRDEKDKLDLEQHELEKSARETRLSLEAIEKNTQAADLRAKLTQRLKEVTSRLEQVTRRQIEVGMAIKEHEVRFADAIREIRLVSPPPAEAKR